MKDYVVIKGEGLGRLYDEHGDFAFSKVPNTDIAKACLSELCIPKSLLYPKIQFTEAEKAEFDKLDKADTLHDALEDIQSGVYNNLRRRLYNHCDDTFIKEQEAEFARAWADPSLIEVLPEKKWHVRAPKVMDTIYIKNDDGSLKTWKKTNAKISDTFPIEEWYKTQFTTEELKHYGLDNDLFEKVEVSE